MISEANEPFTAAIMESSETPAPSGDIQRPKVTTMSAEVRPDNPYSRLMALQR